MSSRHRAGSWATVLLSLAMGGCDSGKPATTEAHHDELTREQTERLLALGYVDVAPALPEDAPVGVTLSDRERAQPGVTMFSDAKNCETHLMDMDGTIRRSWSHEPCFRWSNNILLPGGDLFVIGRLRHGTSPESARDARYVMRMSWDGDTVWQKLIPAHHDAELTPDGELMVLTYALRDVPSIHATLPVRDVLLTVLDSEGEVLEEHSLLDAILEAPEVFHLREVPPRDFEGSGEIDPLHANSVELIHRPDLASRHPGYADNHVMICMRNQDAVVIFERETMRPVWVWGPGALSAPHDATMLADGNILVFDNGVQRGRSRVVELDPVQKRVVWMYGDKEAERFYTVSRGAAQRLRNGNTLITESAEGRIFEVTRDGEIVWDYVNPNLTPKREPGVVVRARRFEDMDYAGLERHLKTAGSLPQRVD